MALIPEDTIDEIRRRVDIVAVIGQHVQLKRAGRNHKGLCPFHGERSPSFNVNPDKGFFYCFGCHKKGDAFTFVMEFEGKSFHEAAEHLAGLAGVIIPEVEESPALRRARGERAQMLEVNKLATAFFREILAHPQHGAPGRAYLAQRGIGQEITDRFQLGYAPADWHALADHLKAKRVDAEIAVKVGLIARQVRAGGFYDRFRDRLVCPVVVPGGEVAGFSARVVGEAVASDGQPLAKYINSPESPVYKKSRLLFGLAQARESFRAKNRAILVEGNFDVISLHQAGFTEVVAPLGTALTTEQVEQLQRLAPKVVLCYDGDRAGRQATRHALELMLAADIPVAIAWSHQRGAALADGQDPDSMTKGGQAEALADMFDRARDGLTHYAVESVMSAPPSADARSRVVEDVVKLVAKVASQTKRDLITGTLASAMQLDPGVIQRALSRAAADRGRASGASAATPSSSDRGDRPAPHPFAPGGNGHDRGDDRGDHGGGRPGQQDQRVTAGANGQTTAPVIDRRPPPSDEVELVALLADHPQLLATAEEHKVLSLLTDARLRDMYSAARAGQSLHELAPQTLPSSSAELVLSAKYAPDTDPTRTLRTMASNLSRRGAQLGQDELKRRLTEAQRRGDQGLVRQLLNEIVTTRKQVD